MELIKISINAEGQNVVSARDLYAFLEIKTKFTMWCERMFEYDFVENQDYVLVSQKRETNNPKNPYTTEIDYALTLTCAKEMCMIQRNERGRQARRYFIDCETKLKNIQANAEFLPEALKTTLNEMIQKNNAELKTDILQEVITKNEMDKIIKSMDEGLHNFYDWLTTNFFENFEKRLDKLEGKFDTMPPEKLADMELCYVYFLREGDTDIFKFGFSIGTKERAQKLNIGNSKKLTLVWQIPFKNTESAKGFEDFLKMFFVTQNIRGEWYTLTYHDFEYIQQQTEIHTAYLETLFNE